MLVDLIKPEIEVALKALKSYPTLDPIDEKVYLRLIDGRVQTNLHMQGGIQ